MTLLYARVGAPTQLARYVRFAPKSGHSFHLVDYIVGAGEQCRRHNEAKGLSRLEIDDEIEFRRLKDR
jgi:hypothetical protein